jgi:hypothetical protein
MASELSWRGVGTGVTVYATIRSSARTMWNTAGTPALEALTVANWADYDIALAESPASSYFYVGTWPATLTTAGWYWLDIYQQPGATPAISDTLLGTLIGYWDGTSFLPWADDARQIAGDGTAATNAAKVYNGAVVANTVHADAGNTTTVFITHLTEATSDQYNGAILAFTSGDLAGEGRRISDYDGGTKTITVESAFTAIPADNTAFVILGRIEV